MTQNHKWSLGVGLCLTGFAVFTFCTDGKLRQLAEQIEKERKVVTCEQLARSRSGDLKYVTLTDFEAYKPFYCWDKHSLAYNKPVYDGNYWDGDYALIPVYATTKYDQQPCNELVRVVLDTHGLISTDSPEILLQLRNRRVDGEICWLTEHEKKSLQLHFPGIRPFLCKVVALGRWTPTQHGADRERRMAVGACVIGIPMVIFGIYGKFRRKPRQSETTHVW